MADYNNLPVSISYQFQDLESNEAKETKQYTDFFSVGQKFPLVKQFKFDNKEGQMTLNVSYDENAQLLTGLPHSIA